MRIVSWNANGIAAAKEPADWMLSGGTDVFCLHGEAGGLAIYTREDTQPMDIQQPMGGVLIAEYIDFYLLNICRPACGREALEEYIENIRYTTGRGVITCGENNAVEVSPEIAPLVKERLTLQDPAGNEYLGIELDY